MSSAAILNVNKPPGWTSFDVVRFVRGRSGVRRVGHAGTLDPAATGVLPLLLSRATRLTEYLVDASKTYAATVELGVETDTYDRDGTVLAAADATHLSLRDVEEALADFRGEIEQRPPAYSAIKREGVPLYKRARRGEAVEAPARRVRVDRLDVVGYEPPFLRLEIDCGKGFYVRSLAHDLGRRVGVGGTLAALVRTRVGPFRLDDAVEVETLKAGFETGEWAEWLLAPDEVLLNWRAAILGEANELRLRRGQTLTIEPETVVSPPPGEPCRAYNASGDFLAVLRCFGSPTWRPEKVLA